MNRMEMAKHLAKTAAMIDDEFEANMVTEKVVESNSENTELSKEAVALLHSVNKLLEVSEEFMRFQYGKELKAIIASVLKLLVSGKGEYVTQIAQICAGVAVGGVKLKAVSENDFNTMKGSDLSVDSDDVH